MDIIRVISTLLMIALILIVVKKKYYVVASFMAIGFVSLLIVTIATGQSVLRETASGNMFIDIFEVMSQAVTRSLGTTGLVIMVVMGYVAYMRKIKASDLFSMIVSTPLKKLKSPNIVLFLTFFITIVVKLAIPSSSSLVTLLLATVYPVLLSVGISRQTAASCLMLAVAFVWGPANTLAYTAFNAAGLTDISVPLYFATKEIIPILVAVLVGSIACISINRYFDKKNNVEIENKAVDETDAKNFGIPSFYAIFPLLPVTLVIIFSQIGLKSVNISVVAAHFLSIIVVLIVELLRKRNISEVFDSSRDFFGGMGKAFENVVSILIGVNIFSAGLSAVGGLPVLANSFMNMGGTAMGIGIATSIMAFALIAIGSSISGTLPLFASVFPQFASSQAELVNMIRILIFSGGLGSAITPIAPAMIIVSGACDVEITTIIKRTIMPAIISTVVIIVTSLLLP